MLQGQMKMARTASMYLSRHIPALWVFITHDHCWAVRLEGEDSEWRRITREDAIFAARLIGETYPSCRVHIQMPDGRFCTEEIRGAQLTGPARSLATA